MWKLCFQEQPTLLLTGTELHSEMERISTWLWNPQLTVSSTCLNSLWQPLVSSHCVSHLSRSLCLPLLLGHCVIHLSQLTVTSTCLSHCDIHFSQLTVTSTCLGHSVFHFLQVTVSATCLKSLWHPLVSDHCFSHLSQDIVTSTSLRSLWHPLVLYFDLLQLISAINDITAATYKKETVQFREHFNSFQFLQ